MFYQIDCLSCGYRRDWPTLVDAIADARHHTEQHAACAQPALVTPRAETPLRGPALPEVHERRCPYCRSERVAPVGRVIVIGEAIKAEHRCEACRTAFLIVETMIS